MYLTLGNSKDFDNHELSLKSQTFHCYEVKRKTTINSKMLFILKSMADDRNSKAYKINMSGYT